MTPTHLPPPKAIDPRSVICVGDAAPSVRSAIEVWCQREQLDARWCSAASDISLAALRADRPALMIVVAAGDSDRGAQFLIQQLRIDGRLQTVPIVCAAFADREWLIAGADDVIAPTAETTVVVARLAANLRRSRRDLEVNPSTRLAGANALASAIEQRIAAGASFAACYADLDHFKEFNDRYGFHQGDDVIRSIANIIVEVVSAEAGGDGFVSHIGGDDFLFLVPTERVVATCDALIQRADEVLPSRYSVPDRQAGYFFGKDRRGRLDRVPLMTLSVGVVSNTRRRFVSAAQVSELATEMKSYAKTLPGSVWAMDRRSDGESVTPPEEKHQ
jgi:GGDEF domain-containing protein